LASSGWEKFKNCQSTCSEVTKIGQSRGISVLAVLSREMNAPLRFSDFMAAEEELPL
jgi:hypothetical protein